MHFEQYNFILEQLLLSAEPLKVDVSKKESLYLKISTERRKDLEYYSSYQRLQTFFLSFLLFK